MDVSSFYSYRHLGPAAFVVRSFDLEWQVTQNFILYTHPLYSPVAFNFTRYFKTLPVYTYEPQIHVIL